MSIISNNQLPHPLLTSGPTISLRGGYQMVVRAINSGGGPSSHYDHGGLEKRVWLSQQPTSKLQLSIVFILKLLFINTYIWDVFIANNCSAGVRKYLPIYFSDTPEEGVTEETPPAEETSKLTKAAKRKRPAEKRATKSKKSEQVSEHEPLSVLNKRQAALLPFCFMMDRCF